MNRFTRNNLFLIIVIVCSCIAAAVLLVFSLIRYFAMSQCISQIEKLRQEIIALGKRKPAPVDENREPIMNNTKLYANVDEQLLVYFKPHMHKVAKIFVGKLQESNPQKDSDGRIVPLTPEKFVNDYNEMWNRSQHFANRNFNYREFREHRFKNWSQAIREVMPEAQKYTSEPLDPDSTAEVLLAALGIPRTLMEQPENMVKYMNNYQAALIKLMTNVKFNAVTDRIDWFGFAPDPKPANLMTQFPNPREQYPMITTVWDIYGDVVTRMVKCSKIIKKSNGTEIPWTKEIEGELKEKGEKFTTYDDSVETFFGLGLRGIPDRSVSNSNTPAAEAMNQAMGGDDSGRFKIYRLRLQIGGSIAGVRTMIKALDEAYKDHRFYIVRSVALFAERDDAEEIFRLQAEELGGGEKKTDNNTPEQNVGRGRGRGRGRGAVPAAEKPVAPVPAKTSLAQQKAEEARAKEANSKLKYYERIGYGNVLIGDSEVCRAVIDFDYVVLK